MRVVAIVMLLIVVGPAKAGHYVLRPGTLHAQDFSTIEVKHQPIVYVEDRAGTETRGRLLSITPTAIAIDVNGAPRTFTPSEVTKIERRGDSLKNGMLIGAALGLLGPLIADCPGTARADRQGGCAGARVGMALGGVAIWAGIGAGIDALIPGRTRVWPVQPK